MFKRNALAMMVGLAAAVSAGSANAITWTNTPYVGYIDIDIIGYDSGTTGYAPTGFDPFGPASQGGFTCTSVAGCDSAAAFWAPGGIGSEDTWGVFQVNGIRDIDGNNLWVASSTERLYGMFYGFADMTVEWTTATGGASFNFTTWSTGGMVQIFEHTSANSDFADINGAQFGAANRTAANGYLMDGTTQVNNGNLFLQMTAAPGQSEVPGATLESHFTSTSAAGGSNVYFDVSGGSAASLFYSDYADENGVLRDIFINNTNSLNNIWNPEWTVRSAGDTVGSAAIPEPGSMALVGLGLVGLAGLRRRKQA